MKNGKRCITKVPLNAIRANCLMPVTEIGRSYRALVKSIKDNGIRTPVCVAPLGDGTYELIAGRRRYNAAKKVGLKEIPAVICETGDRDDLIARMMRDADGYLNMFEEAENYRRILENGEFNQKTLSGYLGKSQSYISNKLRLLMLSPAVRRKVIDAKLSERHARELLRLYDEKLQKIAVDAITEQKMSVKQTVSFIDAVLEKTHQDLLKGYRKIAEEFKIKAGLMSVAEKKTGDHSGGIKHFVGAVKELVEISEANGLRVLAGQRITDKYVELVIKVHRNANTDVTEEKKKAA